MVEDVFDLDAVDRVDVEHAVEQVLERVADDQVLSKVFPQPDVCGCACGRVDVPLLAEQGGVDFKPRVLAFQRGSVSGHELKDLEAEPEVEALVVVPRE